MKKNRNIKKYFLGMIFGILFSRTIVYAGSSIADNIGYKDNTSFYNVSLAINEIYERVYAKKMMCPGCVYRKSSSQKYNVNSNSSSKTNANSQLSSSEYTTDYKTLNSNYFLGHILDSNGKILVTYACGINNNVFFCLRGVDSSQSSLTYKPFYQENMNILKKVFSVCNNNTCSGSITASVDDSGSVRVSSGSSQCLVNYDGNSNCS